MYTNSERAEFSLKYAMTAAIDTASAKVKPASVSGTLALFPVDATIVPTTNTQWKAQTQVVSTWGKPLVWAATTRDTS